MSRYSVKNLLSHSTEKLRRGNFPFYTIFLVSKYFMDTRWGVKEGGASRYSFKIILSQGFEIVVGEPFSFIQKFWYRKTSWLRGGE